MLGHEDSFGTAAGRSGARPQPHPDRRSASILFAAGLPNGAAVGAAVADGAVRVGESAGLSLHRFPLSRTPDAHDAVQQAVVGKVLIDVTG